MSHKEALTLARQLLWRYRHETPIGNQPHMICQEVDEAFERIDEALAQPELCKYGQEPKSCTSSPMDCQCALDATFAQPEQETVEWGVDWGPDGNSVSIIKRLADGGIEVVAWEYAPHPPKRTWVGLTLKEILDTYRGPDGSDYVEYARGLEAKLKEKNFEQQSNT